MPTRELPAIDADFERWFNETTSKWGQSGQVAAATEREWLTARAAWRHATLAERTRLGG